MEEKRTPRKKGKKKNHIGCATVLFLALIALVVVNYTMSYGNRLETTIVRSGTEEEHIAGEGYIFREQTVIDAPADGYLYCEAQEDERVSRGEAVMYIYKNQINVAAINELKEVEKQIAELSENMRTSEVFSSDTAKIEQTISQNLRRVPMLGAEDDIGSVEEICESVNELIDKRRIILGEKTDDDHAQKLNELKNQKARLEQEYDIERTIIHAPATGAFTARIDGLEEMLMPSALENINAAYMKELDKLSAQAKTSETVQAGQPMGKIVNNFTWNVAVQVSKREAESLKVGDSIKIRFPDMGVETISAKITKITPEESGKVIVVANSNKYLETIYSTSRADVELIMDFYDGLRIPAKSIRMLDGTMGVYVIRSNKARFVPVEMLYSGKDWVVVREIMESDSNPKVLKLYDELIISGKNIYDGKVVR